MFDEQDRRYRYLFINCTNCGPRFTIIENIPYGRGQTTIRDFRMCDECRAEYENPLDRRFHAEPTACANCGPKLFLTDSIGTKIAEIDIIEKTQLLLSQGKIMRLNDDSFWYKLF